MTEPAVVQSTTKRDILIGLAVGVLVLGFIIYGIMAMSRGVVGQDLTGTIVAKHFKPQEEQQITIGRGGVRERQLDGQYTFEIQVPPENKIYTVWVDKTVYDARNVGDSFRFPRPNPTPP